MHASTDYTRKFYAHLQLFVRGHAAALYGAADISIGLNEAGMAALTSLQAVHTAVQTNFIMSLSSVSTSAKDNCVPGAPKTIRA